MKTVVNSGQVAHLFANRAQTEARNGQGNFSFKVEHLGDKLTPYYVLYSYSTPIAFQAAKVRKGKPDFVFITSTSYSNTTSGQVSALRGAASHRQTIAVPGAARGWSASADWIRNTMDAARMADALRADLEAAQKFALENPRKKSAATRVMDSWETAQSLLLQIHGKNAVRRLKFKVVAVTSEAAQKHREAVAAARAKDEEARREEGLRRQAAMQKEYDEKLPRWRAGENVRLPYRFEARALLRLSADGTEIETSEGARVGLEVAVAFYQRLLRSEVAKGQHVGVFRVSEMDSETLVIGCHRIDRSEMQALYAKLGYGQAVAA